MDTLARVPHAPVGLGSLSELFLALHHAAADTSTIRDLLERCSGFFNAPAVSLSLVESGKGKWRHIEVYPGISEHVSQYEQQYADTDPIRLAVATVPEGQPVLLAELLATEEQRNHPFVTDIWRRTWGYTDLLLVRIEVEERYDCYFGLIRTEEQPPFGSWERELLGLLVPHLQLAMKTQGVLDRLGIFSQIALEQMLQAGQGLVILSEDAAPLYLNRVAARLIRDTGLFREYEGRLEVTVPDAGPTFRAMLDQCVNASQHGADRIICKLSLPRASGTSLELAVMPFTRPPHAQNLLAQRGRAVVTMHESGRASTDVRKQLIQIYGLSEAESTVCWRVSNGDSLPRIAMETGSTRETVRSQLKRVFAKTGVRRQPDLVRLVLAGPAAWVRIP